MEQSNASLQRGLKADVRRRMSPPHRQSFVQISAELGIHLLTLYNWRRTWRLQGEVVPASEKDPEGWGSTEKFTDVLETAGLNATELSAYCRERGLYPKQVERWRQASQDANEKPVFCRNDSGHPNAALASWWGNTAPPNAAPCRWRRLMRRSCAGGFVSSPVVICAEAGD